MRIDKNGEEITKRNYNLLIVQGLLQVLYQILLIIFVKEFIKLNVNMDMMINNMRFVELNISIVIVFLNT